MTHYVYRLWDGAGDLLYVGVTGTPDLRIKNHRRDQPWADCIASVTTEGPFDRATAQQQERNAIRSENPRHNRVRMTTETVVPGRSPSMLLADAILGGTLDGYVAERRAAGHSWRIISLALRDDVKVDVSHETLRQWFRGEEWASRGRRK